MGGNRTRNIRLLAVPTALLLVGSTAAAVVRISDRPAIRLTDGPAALRAVAEATRSEGSVRIALRYESRLAGTSFSLEGVGAIDFRSGEATFAYEQSAAGAMEIRAIDGTTYMKMPAMLAGAGIKTPWVSIGSEAPAAPATSAPVGLPLDVVRALESGRGFDGLRALGDAKVRGARTLHYLVKPTESPSVAGATSARGVEVWIDFDGRLRRVRTTTTTTTAEGATSTFVEAQEYHDFGVALPRLQRPPTELVTSFASFQELGELARAMADQSPTIAAAVREPYCRGRGRLEQAVTASPPDREAMRLGIEDIDRAIDVADETTIAEKSFAARLRAIGSSARSSTIHFAIGDESEVATSIASLEEQLSKAPAC